MEGITEKVSVNMNVGTLSQIDLLVDLGYYSNRSDFINQAVRQVLDQKQTIIENESRRHQESNSDWFIGVYVFTKEQLLHAREEGKKITVRGYGLLIIGSDLDELAVEMIEKIDVKGRVVASDFVKGKLGIKK